MFCFVIMFVFNYKHFLKRDRTKFLIKENAISFNLQSTVHGVVFHDNKELD